MGATPTESYGRWLGGEVDAGPVLLEVGAGGSRCRELSPAQLSPSATPTGGTTIRVPLRVDIDHVVPLGNAWRSGARRWTEARRRAFANDPRNLMPSAPGSTGPGATTGRRSGCRPGGPAG